MSKSRWRKLDIDTRKYVWIYTATGVCVKSEQTAKKTFIPMVDLTGLTDNDQGLNDPWCHSIVPVTPKLVRVWIEENGLR